jgi:hypothetical protein
MVRAANGMHAQASDVGSQALPVLVLAVQTMKTHNDGVRVLGC